MTRDHLNRLLLALALCFFAAALVNAPNLLLVALFMTFNAAPGAYDYYVAAIV
jgi:hypothetical protein